MGPILPHGCVLRVPPTCSGHGGGTPAGRGAPPRRAATQALSSRSSVSAPPAVARRGHTIVRMSEPTASSTAPAPESTAPYGTGAQAAPQRRVRIPHLMQMKERGEKWSMLTAYDMYTAEIFDEAGIPVLLVGDSA